MEIIVETHDLCKKYGKKWAVDHVDMHVHKGDIYGFIGKNGAGKTTVMKMLLGLTSPTSGNMRLFDSDKLGQSRKRIGSLIEAPGLYLDETARENMVRFAILYGADSKTVNELLAFVGLQDVGRKKAKHFSLGMKQRLGIAIALLGDPELLVLDEPMNGLDPAGIKEVRDVILRMREERGVTVLISSHILDELAKISTRYGIIADGKLVDEVSVDELQARCRKCLTIDVDQPQKAIALLQEKDLLGEYSLTSNKLSLFSHVQSPAFINKTLVENGVAVNELTSSETQLEDYFIQRLGK